MHIIEAKQSQDQTGRLIIFQENPGSSPLCSPAQGKVPRAVQGHCTIVICNSVLLHWNTGQSHSQWNLGPLISAAFALQDLLVWSFPVDRHQFKFTSWLGMSWERAKPKACCWPALQCWDTLKPICTALESAVGSVNKQTLCFHKTTELLSTPLIRVFWMLTFLDSIGKCHQRPNKKRDLCWGSFDRMDVSYYWLQRKESEPSIIVVLLKHSFGISAWHPPLQKLKTLSRLPQHSLESGMETHCLGEVTHKWISCCMQTHFPHRCRAVPETPL